MPLSDEMRFVVGQWLRYARADLALARAELPDDGLMELLCFHAQQATEKAIKAVLIARGVDLPRTHNLAYLITLLGAEATELPRLADAVSLTPYAVAYRYPSVQEPVTAQEHSEAVRIASAVVDWASAQIADYLSGDDPDDHDPAT